MNRHERVILALNKGEKFMKFAKGLVGVIKSDMNEFLNIPKEAEIIDVALNGAIFEFKIISSGIISSVTFESNDFNGIRRISRDRLAEIKEEKK